MSRRRRARPGLPASTILAGGLHSVAVPDLRAEPRYETIGEPGRSRLPAIASCGGFEQHEVDAIDALDVNETVTLGRDSGTFTIRRVQ